MQVGHFFELDKNSFLHKGEVIFRYLRVQSDKTKPRYPIYISFKKHRIDFDFHGYLYSKNLNNYEFVETTILSLHISTNESVINRLNKTLENIFDSQFPFNNYILDNKNEDAKGLERFNIFDNDNLNPQKNIVSFVKLDFLKATNQDVNNSTREAKKEENKTGSKLLVRHLLIDFIYDIEYSEIFQACPYFTDALNLLKENLLFQAITAKAKFYLAISNFSITKTRFIDNKKQKDKHILSAKSNENIEYFISRQKEQVVTTKEEWLEIIQKHNADKVIKERNKKKYWFTEIEKELVSVYDNTEPILEPKKHILKSKRDLRERSKSSDWLIERYNIWDGFKLIFRKETLLLIASIALLLTIGYAFLVKKESYVENVTFYFLKLAYIFSLFFYVGTIIFMLFRIGFAYTFRLILFNLIILFLSSLLLTFDIDTIRNSLFDASITSPLFITSFTAIIILSFFFVFSIERYERPVIKKWKSFRNAFILIALSFFYTFNISIIIPSIFGSERFSQENFLEDHWNKVVKTYEQSSSEFKNYISNQKDSLYFAEHIYNPYFKNGKKEEPKKQRNINTHIKDEQLYEQLSILKVKDGNTKIKYRLTLINKNIDIFPALSLMNTVLALLIGIFIQLIMNRKRLTDM